MPVIDVMCAGIVVADIFSEPIDFLPEPGQLRLSERFVLSAGGCAVNTAACLRRLGRTVSVLGKVGTDFFGDFVLSDLRRLGIDASHIRQSRHHPTSSTFILNVRGEDRRYVHCIGANADFSAADVDPDILKDVRILYVGGYLAMPGFDAEQLAALLRAAKERSVLTVLDVVVPAEGSFSMEHIASPLVHTDVFLPNEDEARMLTGREEAVRQVQALGAVNPKGIIVVTRGQQGAVARCGNHLISIGAFEVDFVDGSGAGDAFAAGFITGLLERWPLEQTLRFASAVGASCTTALGCTEGVFHFEEALSFVAQHALPVTPL